ncbi:hypothetical protein BvCmsB22A_04747 [Escherichia coli]|nr:hypothetical protein BvCmsB22A_04747 [Escherichia coli]
MERAVLRVEHAVTKANQAAGGGFLLRNNQLQGVHHGGHLPGGERRAQTLKQPGHIPGKVLWRQHLPDTIFIAGQKLAVGIDRERLAVMLIDTHGLFAGTHGGKLCFAHGVERAFSRWPDGIVNGLTGGLPAVLREGIIPVTEDRRQGNNTFTRICGCGGFFLAVTAEVTVCGKDNLTGRMLLPGKAGQRKEVHGRKRHHHRFTGQVMYGKCGRVSLRYPQTFSGLILSFKGVTGAPDLSAFQGALTAVSTD